MATVVIAGTVVVKPERREEAIRAAETMIEATRAEPGCVAYSFSIDVADPSTVHIFEEWESEDALTRHFATPHMARFREVLPRVLGGPVALRRYLVASAAAM